MVSRQKYLGGGHSKWWEQLGGIVMGLSVPLPKIILALQHMTLFGNKVFTDDQVKVRP